MGGPVQPFTGGGTRTNSQELLGVFYALSTELSELILSLALPMTFCPSRPFPSSCLTQYFQRAPCLSTLFPHPQDVHLQSGRGPEPQEGRGGRQRTEWGTPSSAQASERQQPAGFTGDGSPRCAVSSATSRFMLALLRHSLTGVVLSCRHRHPCFPGAGRRHGWAGKWPFPSVLRCRAAPSTWAQGEPPIAEIRPAPHRHLPGVREQGARGCNSVMVPGHRAGKGRGHSPAGDPELSP